MNYFMLYSNLAMFICMAVSFTYGVVRFFKKGKALYLQMIVGGLGCMMLGRAFQFITLLTRGMLPKGFHIGTLGIVGGFLFFLSAKRYALGNYIIFVPPKKAINKPIQLYHFDTKH